MNTPVTPLDPDTVTHDDINDLLKLAGITWGIKSHYNEEHHCMESGVELGRNGMFVSWTFAENDSWAQFGGPPALWLENIQRLLHVTRPAMEQPK